MPESEAQANSEQAVRMAKREVTRIMTGNHHLQPRMVPVVGVDPVRRLALHLAASAWMVVSIFMDKSILLTS